MTQYECKSVADVIKPFANSQGGLLPALHALQKEHGYIDPSFHLILADAFNLSSAEIRGVVSFYHDFRSKPHGKHLLRICQAEACQSVGSVQLTNFVKDLTGLALGETSNDDSLTVEAVYCLGLCAAGPAVEFDGAPIARVSSDRLAKFISAAAKDIVS